MENPLIGLDNLKTFLDNIRAEIDQTEKKISKIINDANTNNESKMQQYINTLKNELTTNIGERITNEINRLDQQLKQYTDNKITQTTETINQTITSVKNEAKSYTDNTVNAAKSQINQNITQQISDVKNEQKNYTDTKVSQVQNTVQNYTDQKIDQTKTEVKQYTDTNIQNVKQVVNTYTDTKIQQTKESILKESKEIIKTEIVHSVDSGAVKLVKEEITAAYKKYADEKNNAQNDDWNIKLNALKKSMENYSDQAISAVVGGAPQVLDTLYELSNALGNDPNFSTTITNLIGQKLNASEVSTTPQANKVLRLDANGKIPSSVLNISGAGGAGAGFMSAEERAKLAGIQAGATKYTHPATHPASMITEDPTRRFFTDAERAKLNGIQNNANNYVHPANHPASMIIQDANNRFMTDAERNKLNSIAHGANNYVPPPTHHGSMITEDGTHRWFTDAERAKLAGIQAGATAGGGITGIGLGDNNVTGVLPVHKGGTGSTSVEQFIQMMYRSGDKQNADFGNIFFIVFEDGGRNSGRIKLADLRKKFLPTDEEFKQYLLRLPTI